MTDDAMEAGRRVHESGGHIGFFGPGGGVPHYELFEFRGQVYRAPVQNTIDINTGVRCGARWQCTREHFDRNRKHYTGESDGR